MTNRFLQNYNHRTLERSRLLRKESTKSEKKLWMFIRKNQLGVHFRRQVPIGNCIVDFASITSRIVVEVDGSQHYTKEGRDWDRRRDQYLTAREFTVLRFSNVDVIKDIDAVLEKIQAYIVKSPERQGDLSPALPYEGREVCSV